jgi:hypothetical protein
MPGGLAVANSPNFRDARQSHGSAGVPAGIRRLQSQLKAIITGGLVATNWLNFRDARYINL